jgi:hypothetical protein
MLAAKDSNNPNEKDPYQANACNVWVTLGRAQKNSQGNR